MSEVFVIDNIFSDHLKLFGSTFGVQMADSWCGLKHHSLDHHY